MPIDKRDPVIADILQRLERLEEEKAILGTLYSYSHFHDTGRGEKWVGLFTADATVDARRPKTRNTMKGHAAMRAYQAELKAKREPWHAMKHVMTSPRITINGDTAEVEAYWLSVNNQTPQRGPKMSAFGHYRDRLVKQNGQWLFKERIVTGEAYDNPEQ